MAAEARADSSAAPAAAAPPPLPVPEKRSVPEDAVVESRPETKRRRACVAALDGVPGAAAAGGHGNEEDGPSFSFQHARGGFAALETTPKFGSFNPPPAAQQEALDPARSGKDSPAVRGEEYTAPAPGVEEGGKDGNSQSAAAVDDKGRRHPERQTESER